MHWRFVSERILYDGTQLSSLWAYRSWGIQGDSIVSFRGPCDIEFKYMVDMEDILRSSPIYSTDMLHFIVEHFDLDLEKTILRQRLLITIIKEAIEPVNQNLRRLGDDLYLGEKKLSISIATLTPVSTMIHTGLNISSENTPVETVGLTELGWSEEQLLLFAEQICQGYIREMQGVHRARCKVRGVS